MANLNNLPPIDDVNQYLRSKFQDPSQQKAPAKTDGGYYIILLLISIKFVKLLVT